MYDVLCCYVVVVVVVVVNREGEGEGEGEGKRKVFAEFLDAGNEQTRNHRLLLILYLYLEG